jgi:hypothetical protein
MQPTKLRAEPERRDKVPPRAPAGRMDGGTAPQLIRSVQRTIPSAKQSQQHFGPGQDAEGER